MTADQAMLDRLAALPPHSTVVVIMDGMPRPMLVEEFIDLVAMRPWWDEVIKRQLDQAMGEVG